MSMGQKGHTPGAVPPKFFMLLFFLVLLKGFSAPQCTDRNRVLVRGCDEAEVSEEKRSSRKWEFQVRIGSEGDPLSFFSSIVFFCFAKENPEIYHGCSLLAEHTKKT